nr:unnamed protein product [Digitaria exilis]
MQMPLSTQIPPGRRVQTTSKPPPVVCPPPPPSCTGLLPPTASAQAHRSTLTPSARDQSPLWAPPVRVSGDDVQCYIESRL